MLRKLFFVLFFLLLTRNCQLITPIFATEVPPVIPDSANTNQLYTGSFDSQYPNKNFIPNDTSGVSCEYQLSAEKDVGGSGVGDSGTVTINQEFTNQKTDYDNRNLNTNEYHLSPCDPSDTTNFDQCVTRRNNSMNTENINGASSPIQRQLPQADKNKILCSRWQSGLWGGNKVINTDEQVGCYCGGDSSTVPANGAACPSSCREVYFSELAQFNTDFCPLAPDIATYYNCGSGTCPFFTRNPAAKSLPHITAFVARQLIKNVSIVPKGSIGTAVTQKDTNQTTIGVLPFLMAPSSDQSINAVSYVFPAAAQPNTSNPSCSPVDKPAGPDEYKIDFIAQIKAFFGIDHHASGTTTIKQEVPQNTTIGLGKDAGLNTLVPQTYLNTHPVVQASYSKTNNDGQTLLNPSTNVTQFRLNLTPASWQH